ncbi:flavin reductase (DIM6/NTAB) family NADH-FMN oxidoreductase RutF [Clostridium beijerinckii]|uniref:flavin reductase n=1 Tax=Clostridium beijerinckii TaxID=1520 RepID=UPI0014947451|nr:flavin reductase [Clostridium beijerinckii]NOW90519.1 flavin reductase (DIM6/NTAB) family NADH-FMN oxidoreductase RutF [Clostridium beijerinckii]
MKNSFSFDMENTIDNMKVSGAFLTSGDKNKSNTMTISWGCIGYMIKKPIFVAMVSNIRYTKEFIDKNNTFTVSIPYNKSKEKALKICGHNSGRDMNKEIEADIKFVQAKSIDSPIVEGCDRYYECKIVFKQEIDLEKVDDTMIYGDNEAKHTIYFGEIIEEY